MNTEEDMWTVCSKCSNHSRLSVNIKMGGPMYYVKIKSIFIFTSYSFCIIFPVMKLEKNNCTVCMVLVGGDYNSGIKASNLIVCGVWSVCTIGPTRATCLMLTLKCFQDHSDPKLSYNSPFSILTCSLWANFLKKFGEYVCNLCLFFLNIYSNV